MKRLFVLFAFAFGSALSATAASAQSDTAERYAACLAQARPDQVRALLHATTADSANRPYRALADDDRCFSRIFGSGQFNPDEAAGSMDVLRGRLAEQELLSQSSQVAALQALPLKQERYIRPWFAATGRHPAVDEMAACLADTDPAGIMALVRTTAGQADESSAISSLGSNMIKCLSAGTRLDASRQALRAALADALYQRFNNPALSMAQAPEQAH